jgi:hypothetical protein
MKRLLDETSSNFERSLLEVGRDVGNSDVGKRRLLSTLALGATGIGAGYVGTSKTWATWLTSQAAKLTFVATGVFGGAAAIGYHYYPSDRAPESAPSTITTSASHVSLVAPPAQSPPSVPANDAPTSAEEIVTAPLPTPISTQPSSSVAARKASHGTAKPAPRLLLEEARVLQRLRDALERADGAAAGQITSSYWQQFGQAGQLQPEFRRLDERRKALSKERR